MARMPSAAITLKGTVPLCQVLTSLQKKLYLVAFGCYACELGVDEDIRYLAMLVDRSIVTVVSGRLHLYR